LMRPAVTLDSLYLEGGTLANGNLNWANPITDAPNGLDITNKGILVQPDAFSGDTIIRNSRISGFRGELVYSSNNSSSRLILEGRCEFSESNGQALNPAGGGIYCPGYVVVWNCNVAFEGWCGMGNLRGEFHNILRGGTITGGVIYQGPNGFFPQRLTEAQFAGQASYFHLDIMITSPQQTIQLGSFFRGKVIAVDTQIGVGSDPTAGPFKGGVIDTDLEIITVVDKASLQTALTLAGSTVSGAKSITNCRYRLSLKRTAAAIAAGYVIVDAVAYGGSIGPDVIIEESSGPSLRGSAPYNQSTQLPDYYPTFRNNAFNRCTDGTTTSHNVSSTPLINVRGDFTGVYNTTNNSTVTATLPTVGIGDGHELTLYNVGGPSGYANVALDRSGGGCILPARRIIGGGDFMRLRFDAVISKWLEVKPPNPMSLNGSITVPAVAANAVSAVQTMTVYGAEPGMAVSISNMNVVSTAYEICQAQVTAANTVSFRVRDVSGAGFASFNLWMEICCEWKRTWLS
jgi:hypothetical protein